MTDERIRELIVTAYVNTQWPPKPDDTAAQRADLRQSAERMGFDDSSRTNWSTLNFRRAVEPILRLVADEARLSAGVLLTTDPALVVELFTRHVRSLTEARDACQQENSRLKFELDRLREYAAEYDATIRGRHVLP